jgi:hypothetical protein
MILLFTITTPSNYFVVTTPYFPPFLIRFLIPLRPKLETMSFEKHVGPKVPSILKKKIGKSCFQKILIVRIKMKGSFLY